MQRIFHSVVVECIFVVDSHELSNGRRQFHAFVVEVAHHIPLFGFHLSFSPDIVKVMFHGVFWIRDVELTPCKKHERESSISRISDFDSVY
jgi:hypothetical protein